MCHHAWLIFKFFVETECHYVSQASLKLLGSSDPPASVSKSAGITGMSDRAQQGINLDMQFQLEPVASIMLHTSLYRLFNEYSKITK